MNQSFSKIWIAVIAVVLIAGGFFVWQYFGAPKEEVKTPEEIAKDEIANWKTYEWGRLRFKYPLNWTAEKIYYSTPVQQITGEPPENIGVRLFPGEELKGNDFIAIGGRQISCDPLENHTKCSYVSSVANYIYTDSNNAEVLRVFDQIFPLLGLLR